MEQTIRDEKEEVAVTREVIEAPAGEKSIAMNSTVNKPEEEQIKQDVPIDRLFSYQPINDELFDGPTEEAKSIELPLVLVLAKEEQENRNIKQRRKKSRRRKKERRVKLIEKAGIV